MESRLITQIMKQPPRVRKMVTQFFKDSNYRAIVQDGFQDRGHGLGLDRGDILIWAYLILKLVSVLIAITKEFENAKDVFTGSGGDVR